MFGEREALHKRVLPRVNELAKKYGEYVECTDLRWGLDTEHMGKILEVCLSQIKDPCHYNMIVFLGSYYGTIPDDTDMIKEVWKKTLKTEDELSDYRIGITQLELEYGFFRSHEDTQLPVRICLLRNIEDSRGEEFDQDVVCKKKQEELIARIKKVKNSSTHLIKYKAEWNAGRKAAVKLEDMENKIVEEIEQILKERSAQKQKNNWVEAAWRAGEENTELESGYYRMPLMVRLPEDSTVSLEESWVNVHITEPE